MNPRRRLTVACGAYEHTAALRDGTITIDDIDLRYQVLPADDIFRRLSLSGDFDVAELSLSMYAHFVATGDGRFIALPVFPLRAFRHRHIYVRANDPRSAAELARGRIGLSRYHQTSVVWQCAALAESGLALNTVTWVRAGATSAGLPKARIELVLPEEITIEDVSDRSLPDLLVDGAIDAALLVAAPTGLGTSIRRLYVDARVEEARYFERTGVFPIMHVLVVRSDLAASEPSLLDALVAAFTSAKASALAKYRSGTIPTMLPFAELDFERDARTFGSDPYRYGIEENRATLEAFLAASSRQGLLPTEFTLEALFDARVHLRVVSIESGKRLWD